MVNQQLKCLTMQVTLSKTLGHFITNNHKNIDISNFYMIGDNPEIDILGANISNFISVLVR